MSDSFVTPWTIARQSPLSMGFPRQEYWSGLPFLSPGDLPDPETEPRSPVLAGRFFTTEPPGKPYLTCVNVFNLNNPIQDTIFVPNLQKRKVSLRINNLPKVT